MASLRLSAPQMRQIARLWHLLQPTFVINTLIASRLLVAGDAAGAALAKIYLARAAEIGLWSKADLVQFTGLCLLAGGDVSRIASVRGYLAQVPEPREDVVAGMMLHYGPAWITGLGGKVAADA